MPTGRYWCAVLVALAAGASACSAPPDPITIEEGTITILNQSSREWRNVVVTVNHHFRGAVPRLAAGGRLNASLSQFQTGYGQRFDRSGQRVFLIEVTATDDGGTPVKLQWGKPK